LYPSFFIYHFFTMKNFSSLRLLCAALIAATLSSVAIMSCQKEPAIPVGQPAIPTENDFAGKYTKQIVLHDAGQEVVMLEISTDHAEMLNWFTSNDLILFSAPTDAADQEIEVGNPASTVEATQMPVPKHLVVIKLKKAGQNGQAIQFSERLQEQLNAAGATIRFAMESDEVAERGPIGGSPRRIKLNKNQSWKPAFVYVRWRCANSFYLTNHNWPANNGSSALYKVCPACSSATRYFYNYDYYCSAAYSTVYLSWQSTACN